MSYLEYTDLQAVIPDQFLTQALDDNGDGAPDMPVFEAVRTAAQNAIDGRLGLRFVIPDWLA